MYSLQLGNNLRWLTIFVAVTCFIGESQQRPGDVFKNLKIDMSDNILLKNNQNLSSLLRNVKKRSIKSDEFDYVVFRQIWPATSCMFVKPPTTCSIGKDVDTWVVHGLW